MRLRLVAPLLFCFALTARSTAPPPIAVIPCEIHANGVYVKVSVNGSRPLQFQLDTAAAVHIINWTQAQRLNLPFPASIGTANGGGDGSTKSALMENVRLRIGDFELPPDPVYAVPMDPIVARKGYALDGLLGAALLRRYVVVQDTGAGTLSLYDPATWTYSGNGAVLPVNPDRHGVPHITVGLTLAGLPPLSGEFIIDSGASEGTLALAAPFVEKHKLLEALRSSGQASIRDEMMGVGGTSAIWFARASEVSLAGTRFAQPVIILTEARGGTLAKSEIAGTIGGDLVHRFRVTYDVPHNRMFLDPSARLQLPFETDMSGIRWRVSGPQLREFTVRALLPGSLAERTGIQPEDRLLEVDGRPADTFDIDSLRRHLRRHGQTVRLKFQRAGRQLTVELLLARTV